MLLKLARLAGADFADATATLTREVADACTVERVGVWLLTDPPDHLRCEVLYRRTPDRHGGATTISVEAYPRYFRALADSLGFAVADVALDPRTAELVPGYYRAAGSGRPSTCRSGRTAG